MDNAKAASSVAGETPGEEDHLWPWMIVIGLLFVVVVNIGFITLAVTGADEVAPSYVQGDRWGGSPPTSP